MSEFVDRRRSSRSEGSRKAAQSQRRPAVQLVWPLHSESIALLKPVGFTQSLFTSESPPRYEEHDKISFSVARLGSFRDLTARSRLDAARLDSDTGIYEFWPIISTSFMDGAYQAPDYPFQIADEPVDSWSDARSVLWKHLSEVFAADDGHGPEPYFRETSEGSVTVIPLRFVDVAEVEAVAMSYLQFELTDPFTREDLIRV